MKVPFSTKTASPFPSSARPVGAPFIYCGIPSDEPGPDIPHCWPIAAPEAPIASANTVAGTIRNLDFDDGIAVLLRLQLDWMSQSVRTAPTQCHRVKPLCRRWTECMRGSVFGVSPDQRPHPARRLRSPVKADRGTGPVLLLQRATTYPTPVFPTADPCVAMWPIVVGPPSIWTRASSQAQAAFTPLIWRSIQADDCSVAGLITSIRRDKLASSIPSPRA